jgi:hypothetical protein
MSRNDNRIEFRRQEFSSRNENNEKRPLVRDFSRDFVRNDRFIQKNPYSWKKDSSVNNNPNNWYNKRRKYWKNDSWQNKNTSQQRHSQSQTQKTRHDHDQHVCCIIA